MSLATRCPSCGTVFRVVRDQLKVSDGWVRCGRCSEVFNAVQRLFELELDAPGTMTAPPASAAPPLPPVAPVAPREAEPPQAPTPAAEAVHEPPSGCAPAPQPAAATAEAPTARDADAWREAPPAPAAPTATAEAPQPGPAGEDAAPSPTPEFIRRADRAARQRAPLRLGPLALLALLLLALLAAQIGLHYRDRIAAAWPATRPLLLAACGALGCEVQAPRRIDSLHVDSSGLARIHDSALHRLSLVVRNKAPTPVRMPAVELTLTDAQGLTLARRVFTAAELGQPAMRIDAGAEASLQATLDLGERRVAGYTVELFYP